MSTIVVTLIYNEFWGTEQFRKSVQKAGLPLFNAFDGSQFTGHGDSLRMLYSAMANLSASYENIIYSDGADTIFFKPFTPPAGEIIYSAEKACYPIEAMAPLYPACDTPWKYLNAGNWCGSIELCMRFFETYGLYNYRGEINGQKEVAQAFLEGVKDGFPVRLDYKGEFFQTIAFNDIKKDGTVDFGKGDDFSIENGQVVNNITGAKPCIVHGNGRTNMDWVYNLI